MPGKSAFLLSVVTIALSSRTATGSTLRGLSSRRYLDANDPMAGLQIAFQKEQNDWNKLQNEMPEMPTAPPDPTGPIIISTSRIDDASTDDEDFDC